MRSNRTTSITLALLIASVLFPSLPALSYPFHLAPRTSQRIKPPTETVQEKFLRLLKEQFPEITLKLDEAQLTSAVNTLVEDLKANFRYTSIHFNVMKSLKGLISLEEEGGYIHFIILKQKDDGSRVIRQAFRIEDGTRSCTANMSETGDRLLRMTPEGQNLRKVLSGEKDFKLRLPNGILNAGRALFQESEALPKIAEIMLRMKDLEITPKKESSDSFQIAIIFHAMALFQYYTNSAPQGLTALLDALKLLKAGKSLREENPLWNMNYLIRHSDETEFIIHSYLNQRCKKIMLRKHLVQEMEHSANINSLTDIYGPIGSLSLKEMAKLLGEDGMKQEDWDRVLHQFTEGSMTLTEQSFTNGIDAHFERWVSGQEGNLILKQLVFATFYGSNNNLRDPNISSAISAFVKTFLHDKDPEMPSHSFRGPMGNLWHTISNLLSFGKSA